MKRSLLVLVVGSFVVLGLIVAGVLVLAGWPPPKPRPPVFIRVTVTVTPEPSVSSTGGHRARAPEPAATRREHPRLPHIPPVHR